MMKKSILLVTVDCLRADHVGFMGYAHPTTPFLDLLAAESFVFPVAIVAGAPTYYSLPAILASRYPMVLGRDVLGLGPGEPTLASVLKEAGYATAAFVAANPYISPRFGYEQGFDKFHDFLDDNHTSYEKALRSDNSGSGAPANNWFSRFNRKLQEVRPQMGPARAVYDELYFQYCQRAMPTARSLDALRRFPAAEVIVDQACQWIESIGDMPCFLWLHMMDPHSPYYPKNEAIALMGNAPVSPFRARYLNSFWNRGDLGPTRLAKHREAVVALYDAGIRWVDAQMARLIAALQKSHRWNDCIFALTADHGEEFLDHGARYHPPSLLTEELIHVPLLLRVSSAAKREVATTNPFSLLHLAPTLLDAASLPIPFAFQGTSYWAQLRDGESYNSVAISECVASCTNPFWSENRLGPRLLSVREARYKLVLHFNPQIDNLYDLETDPGEQAPLSSGMQKAVRRRLLEIAREHLRQSLERRDSNARLRAHLRDLQQNLRLEWEKPAEKSSPVAS
jgi:arylsulfatase A-like enzyme